MEIKGKVHCFFEQSGTFKNEFIKLGYKASDYDVQNRFNETDNIIDLFGNIENAYEGNPSIFDNISSDDFIIAFFPCIYFCAISQMAFYPTCINYRSLSTKDTYDAILKRNKDRAYFYSLLCKMFAVVKMRNIRMVVENPWSEQTYLKANFENPTIVDNNRMARGDYMKKPTAYWFINCSTTYGNSFKNNKKKRRVMNLRGGAKAGVCSEERSMISSDYARNFICDFIIGKDQGMGELSLFK